jgi:hypothetical protein
MDTLAFLLFCAAIGYVIVWVIVNERRGAAANDDIAGDLGFLAMRRPPSPAASRPPRRGPAARSCR